MTMDKDNKATGQTTGKAIDKATDKAKPNSSTKQEQTQKIPIKGHKGKAPAFNTVKDIEAFDKADRLIVDSISRLVAKDTTTGSTTGESSAAGPSTATVENAGTQSGPSKRVHFVDPVDDDDEEGYDVCNINDVMTGQQRKFEKLGCDVAADSEAARLKAKPSVGGPAERIGSAQYLGPGYVLLPSTLRPAAPSGGDSNSSGPPAHVKDTSPNSGPTTDHAHRPTSSARPDLSHTEPGSKERLQQLCDLLNITRARVEPTGPFFTQCPGSFGPFGPVPPVAPPPFFGTPFGVYGPCPAPFAMDYSNVGPAPSGFHYQPPVPDTTYGPMMHTYVPRHDAGPGHMVYQQAAPVGTPLVYMVPAVPQPAPIYTSEQVRHCLLKHQQYLQKRAYQQFFAPQPYLRGDFHASIATPRLVDVAQPANNVTFIGQQPQANTAPIVVAQQPANPQPIGIMAGAPVPVQGAAPFIVSAPGVAQAPPPACVGPIYNAPVVGGAPGGGVVGGGVPAVAHPGFLGNQQHPPDVCGVGRTGGEQAVENAQFAHANGLYEPQDFKPADDDPSRFYPVREVDGNWTQRNRFTIDNLGDCRWFVTDAGYFYAVRQPN